MNAKTDAPARGPRLSLLIATAGYAGYLPKAPGTFGSLVGVLLYAITWKLLAHRTGLAIDWLGTHSVLFFWPIAGLLAALVAISGVVTGSRVARWSGKKDPQFAVIDEVSGQLLTYLFALAPLNWKYLALGFILFRGFDIWKPFPARQAEALPGGWGIMADDWIAAIYAALGLWVARAIGL